jgi:hypothetical protein
MYIAELGSDLPYATIHLLVRGTITSAIAPAAHSEFPQGKCLEIASYLVKTDSLIYRCARDRSI